MIEPVEYDDPYEPEAHTAFETVEHYLFSQNLHVQIQWDGFYLFDLMHPDAPEAPLG